MTCKVIGFEEENIFYQGDWLIWINVKFAVELIGK